MGNDNHGSILNGQKEILNGAGILRIKIGKRFIQNHQWCFPEQASCKCNSPLLSSRKIVSVFFYLHVKFIF